MPGQSRSKRPSQPSRKVSFGSAALSAIIRNSRDQVRNAVRGRYIRRGGLSQAITDIAELRKMVNTEEKHYDVANGPNSVVNTASLIQTMTPPAEGSDNNQRTGRSIKVVRIDLVLQFAFSTGTPATTAAQNQVFNWFYIRYLKTPSSSGTTAFAISEFLNLDPGAANYTPLSLPNSDTSENFAVMAQGQVDIDLPSQTTASSTRIKIIQIQIDKAFHQTFNSTTSASIVDNMCFIVVTAATALNTGGLSSCTSNARHWFVDN